MILKCVARCRCLVEVKQEKVVGLQTRRLNASADASASALGHQINHGETKTLPKEQCRRKL